MNIGGCEAASNTDENKDYTEGTVNRLMYSRILGEIEAHTKFISLKIERHNLLRTK